MKAVTERINALRKLMREQKTDACIIPSTDPHISEYPAGHWKCREWISGFTGSAGTVVITADKAGLWTDSRYFLQAEKQLQDTGIELFREKLPETLEIKEWLSTELQENSTVGIDGTVFPATEATSLINYFSEKKITVNANFEPFGTLWENRPAIPVNKVFTLTENFSGISAGNKIKQVMESVRKSGADTTIIASLDTIAWLFNIRGNDVQFNPVVVCYAVLSSKETILFIQPEKLTNETIDYLNKEGVVLADYDKIRDYIAKIPSSSKILLSPAKINYALQEAIPAACKIICSDVHPADQLKSIKNETEITGFRKAMVKDGVALVRFFIWLEKSLAGKNIVTELDISRKLREYRSEQDFYFGESFETIAGYGAHGAIVHYGATEDSNAEIKPDGFLLIDSGAQYFDGTTDITRTIIVGTAGAQMKKDYTLVLKGHIGLANAHFPAGTKGIQLDILARKPLWENGINYMHGTGHGIGHFLNVHEGPQSIRMEYNPATIRDGMVTSNEPGIYRTGEYGIRIENLILATTNQTISPDSYLHFETLTLCPIDMNPVDKSLLNAEEINWINSYHKKVFEKLSPLLTAEETTWLKEKTKEI